MDSALPEVWLRGPLPNIPPLLQPVAHALLQAGEEIEELVKDFPDELLWQRPGGVASVGFHLQHLAGVLDRLFAYAMGHALTDDQLHYLKQEGNEANGITVTNLVQNFQNQVRRSIQQLEETSDRILTEPRFVGRARIPSTVIGLLVHAAEHTTRHTGQLLVTVKILQSA